MTTGRALLACTGGGIGDALVASVVARALRTRFAAVDALALPAHREALLHTHEFEDVLVDEDGDERALVARIAAPAYAACVVTWATPRVARVVRRANIPIRVGQARRLYSHAFTHRVKVRSEDGDVTSPWADILLDYARALDCTTDDLVPSFSPNDADRRAAAELRAALQLETHAFVILNPCNAIASQRANWPIGGWARLARALCDTFEVPVVVSGSPAEVEVARAVVERAADPRVHAIAGRLQIGAFGALAGASAGYVGITTGTMHVAAAVGAPTLGIFPFQSDFPERWAPRGRQTAVVRASYPCHPGDTKERCADYACVEHLDVPRILAAAKRLIRIEATVR